MKAIRAVRNKNGEKYEKMWTNFDLNGSLPIYNRIEACVIDNHE